MMKEWEKVSELEASRLSLRGKRRHLANFRHIEKIRTFSGSWMLVAVAVVVALVLRVCLGPGYPS